uniref:Uncharacterized protein n=1 Tax=Ditylum brightwellii TaxID=49249 RepID=A0A6V2IZS1_9STRA|mmetsp:Transcript_45836/g.69131  ORF Transcript_45836/g.69131 Transcript_45836/m.69131 type:complete len:598 (+) Transcript_45836:199-1992(+)
MNRSLKRKSSTSLSSSIASGLSYEELVRKASSSTYNKEDDNEEEEPSLKFQIAVDDNIDILNNSQGQQIITRRKSTSPIRSPLAGLSPNNASLRGEKISRTTKTPSSNPSKQLVFASPSPPNLQQRSNRRRQRHEQQHHHHRKSEDDSENAFVTRRGRGRGTGRGKIEQEESTEDFFVSGGGDENDDSISISLDQALLSRTSSSSVSAVSMDIRGVSQIVNMDDDDDDNDIHNVKMSSTVQSTARSENSLSLSSIRASSSSSIPPDLVTPAKMYYPDDVKVPGPKVLQRFYKTAIANSEQEEEGGKQQSHQLHLDEIGSGLLSLEEVIIPAIMHEEMEALKRLQALAQRDVNKTSDGELRVKAIELSRLAVKKCAFAAMDAARESRLKREEEEKKEAKREAEIRELARREGKQRAKEKRKREKEEERQRRKKERALAREREVERIRMERKKNLPQNKELWREVAILMTDMARLQKEEKMWADAKLALDKKEERRAKENLLQKENVIETSDLIMVDNNNKIDLDIEEIKMKSIVIKHVEDITLAANRINQTLKSTMDLMDKSDEIRTQMTKRYREDHMFHGYRGVNEPKSLVQSLSHE